MRKFFHLLFLLPMVLGPVLSLAQPKLSIISAESNPPDTVEWPTTNVITYTVVVQNIGNNQLTGPCSIKFKYNTDIAEHSKHTWSATNFEVGEEDTLIFNDTIDSLSGNRYKGGGNIIIIWPHSDNPNTQAPDTTSHDIFIVDISNGIVDPGLLSQRVEVFPNPVRDELSIRYLQLQHKIECVRIMGLDGKLLWESRAAVEEVDMRALPSGMYMVVFQFKDGMRGAVRITKPE